MSKNWEKTLRKPPTFFCFSNIPTTVTEHSGIYFIHISNYFLGLEILGKRSPKKRNEPCF